MYVGHCLAPNDYELVLGVREHVCLEEVDNGITGLIYHPFGGAVIAVGADVVPHPCLTFEQRDAIQLKISIALRYQWQEGLLAIDGVTADEVEAGPRAAGLEPERIRDLHVATCAVEHLLRGGGSQAPAAGTTAANSATLIQSTEVNNV